MIIAESDRIAVCGGYWLVSTISTVKWQSLDPE